MENRDEFKNAIRERLINMIAEDIAKQSDFEKLRNELSSELMKIKTSSYKDIIDEMQPYSEPETSREKSFKKHYGFFLKDGFEKGLAARLKMERAKSNTMSSKIERSKQNIDELVNSLKSIHTSPILSTPTKPSIYERMQNFKSGLCMPTYNNLDDKITILDEFKPNDLPSGTTYFGEDPKHFEVMEEHKEFEPIAEKLEKPKKVKRVQKAKVKKTPNKVTKKVSAKTKKVTAAKRPKKK